MKKEVTVNQAIKKGERLIYYPFILLFSISIILPLAVMIIFNNNWVLPLCLFVVLIFSSILYWAYFVTKWRLWAFENVRNVHELKDKAIRYQLINNDNSFFTKIEIRSNEEKIKWNSLLDKFNEKDVFVDDPTIPPETKIYPTIHNLLFGILLIFLGLVLLKTFVGIPLAIYGIYMAYKNYKGVTNKEPQITISDQGIKTASTKFYKWEQITYENARATGSKNRLISLSFCHPGGREDLTYDNINVDWEELYDLLKLYRGRYNKRQKKE